MEVRPHADEEAWTLRPNEADSRAVRATVEREGVIFPPCVDKFLTTYGSAPVGAEIFQIFTNQTNTTLHLSFTTNKNLQKSNKNDDPVQIPVQFFVRFLKIFVFMP